MENEHMSEMQAADVRERGKRYAYVVIADNFANNQGYLVGIAVEGEKGYYASGWRWGADGDYLKVQEMVDKLNIKLHGNLTVAMEIILSTMKQKETP